MSHNAITINSNEPSRVGAISASPAFPEIRIGGGALSNDYSNSGATALNDSTLYFYDTSPTNNISGATITSSNDWVSSVTLPSGTYILEASFALSFSASGQFSFQWYNGTSSKGTRSQLGGSLSHSTESVSSYATLCITTANSTTFSLKSTSSSTNLNTVADQGTNISEQSFIRIRGF